MTTAFLTVLQLLQRQLYLLKIVFYNRLARKIAIANLGGPVKGKENK